MKHTYTLILGAVALFFLQPQLHAQCTISCGTGSDGAFSASTNTTLPGGTYNYTSFNINAGVTVTVTGSQPLVINCTGNVTINGVLDASGGNGGNGITFSTYGIGGVGVAGGANGADGNYSSSTGPLPGTAGSGTGAGGAGGGWSGGGGAGYGATGQSASVSNGLGGASYGNAQISVVNAGSGGGGGSGGFSCGSGGGGGGGGYVKISTCGIFNIGAAGAIRANGGNGGSDGGGNCGGGGGGSGGSIFIVTQQLINAGTISAVGGPGGASQVPGSPYYGTGGNGAVGRIRIDAQYLNNTGTITPASAYNASLTATFTTSNITCNGNCNGSITANPTGGTPGYTYIWSPGGWTTQTVTNLCAGCYTCVITDAAGCGYVTLVCVTQPPALTASVAVTNVSCNGGCNGSATVTPTGGVPPYSYVWSNGNTASIGSALCAGTYSVTVFDSQGCSTTVSFTITQPPALTISPMITMPQCWYSCDGTISLNTSGGTPPYSYSWSPFIPGGGSSVTNLCQGVYTCNINDANGCSLTYSVAINAPPPITYTFSSQNISCYFQADGTATMNATGGTGTISYSWWPYGGNGPTAINLGVGSYTCTATDSYGCSITASTTITQPPQIQIAFGNNDVTCNGACNGSIITWVTGGVGSYTYDWMPGAGTDSSYTGLCAGCYTLTVTDSTGCFNSASTCITEPPALNLSTSSTPESFTGAGDGSATASASGGFPPYTYLWSTSDTTATVNGLPTGIYTVTVTDWNGCTQTAIDTVFIMTSLPGQQNLSGVSVYPNPTNGILHVEFSGTVNDAALVEVMDITGKVVRTKSFTENGEIDLQDLSRGSYLLRITIDGKVSVKRIVVD